MFQRKSQDSSYPLAIAAALVVTVAMVVATLVEAVAGMETFL
ncbi:MAG TPA: hypothetical protein VFX69_07005 [Steroidobacteraceae bacterium]|jgi:hypothetical protein|nr:hypothetical protein [Steroidobacteraceae bacterium]